MTTPASLSMVYQPVGYALPGQLADIQPYAHQVMPTGQCMTCVGHDGHTYMGYQADGDMVCVMAASMDRTPLAVEGGQQWAYTAGPVIDVTVGLVRWRYPDGVRVDQYLVDQAGAVVGIRLNPLNPVYPPVLLIHSPVPVHADAMALLPAVLEPVDSPAVAAALNAGRSGVLRLGTGRAIVFEPDTTGSPDEGWTQGWRGWVRRLMTLLRHA